MNCDRCPPVAQRSVRYPRGLPMRIHRRCEMRTNGQMDTFVHGPVEVEAAVAEIVAAVGGDGTLRRVVERIATRRLSGVGDGPGADRTVVTVTLECHLRPGDRMPDSLCDRCGYDLGGAPGRCPGCGKVSAA